MTMKQKVQGRLINIGRNLYQDSAGKIYIYDKKQKLAYTLDKNDQLKFQLYRCRFIIPVTLGFLIHYYYPNYVLAILSGMLSFIALQILYHRSFLPNLSMTNRFELPEKESYIKKISNNQSGVLVKRIIGALIIGCIFIWNLLDMGVNSSDLQFIDWNRSLMILLSIAMIVITFISAFIYMMILIQRNKKGDKK